MALEFCEGWDHLPAAGGVTALGKGWTKTATGQTDPLTTAARTGTRGLFINSKDHFVLRPVNSAASKVVGFAYRDNEASAGDMRLLSLMETGAVHVDLRLNDSTRTLYVTRNGTSLGTGTAVITLGSWFYIEVKATINDTTGSVVVRVNGVVDINLTNVDTRNAATGVINQMQFGALNSGVWAASIDDVYVVGTSGGVETDFMGDIGVYTQYPNGNGNSSQLLGSDGNSTDNYALVDETPANGDTDYVSSATAGQKDTYAFSDLPVTGVVKGVQWVAQVRKDDAGARSFAPVWRPGSSDTDGATIAASNTFEFPTEMRETNPDTSSAWTVSEVNSAEYGVKVIA